MPTNSLADVLEHHEAELLTEWIRLQKIALSGRTSGFTDAHLEVNSRDFVTALRDATMRDSTSDISRPEWSRVRDLLAGLSRERAALGLSPGDTAMFVFSFKQPVLELMRRQGADAQTLAGQAWETNLLLDRLGLYTTEVYQKSREEVITRQQQELLELSTPVVELWTGILALPLIGTLDSSRTQVVMQNLLEAIVARSATIAIIDITGVPTVDTLVAQHLLKTVAAARLMGADCIISGIRPQIAQTIIHLGVDLGNVITKATLSDAFQLSLRKLGMAITRS